MLVIYHCGGRATYFSPIRRNSGLLHPATRFSSRRSSLEMVHWTISFAFGEPLLTLVATPSPARRFARGGRKLSDAAGRAAKCGAQDKSPVATPGFFFLSA